MRAPLSDTFLHAITFITHRGHNPLQLIIVIIAVINLTTQTLQT